MWSRVTWFHTLVLMHVCVIMIMVQELTPSEGHTAFHLRRGSIPRSTPKWTPRLARCSDTDALSRKARPPSKCTSHTSATTSNLPCSSTTTTTSTWWPNKACSTSIPSSSGMREPSLTCSPTPKTMPCGTRGLPRRSPSWVNTNRSRARKARFARSALSWIDYSSREQQKNTIP